MPSLVVFVAIGAVVGLLLWGFVATLPVREEIGTISPAVAVTPKEEPSNYYLAVENRGGPGVFFAEIEIVDRPSMKAGERAEYPAIWEDGSGSREIAPGSQGRLQIGTQVDSGKGGFLRVYFNSRNKEMDYLTEEIRSPTSPPLIVVRVKISSVPAMKSGPFVGTYWLTSHSFTDMTSK